jgi:hypothetical protein
LKNRDNKRVNTMAKLYRVPGVDGVLGNWQYFSEREGVIIDAGPDEDIARTMAEAEGEITIANVLEASKPTVLEQDKAETSNEGEPKPKRKEQDPIRLQGGGADARPSTTTLVPTDTKGDEVKKRPPISPQFLRKIKERAASGSAEVSTELERFLFKRFGFTTDELDDDDPDVELLKLGWELQWEYWLAGKEPPAWALILFGQVCVTARLIASAKRIPRKEGDNADQKGIDSGIAKKD